MEEELSDDGKWIADIIITPQTNINVTVEDNGPDDELTVDNLSGSQYRESVTVKMKYKKWGLSW